MVQWQTIGKQQFRIDGDVVYWQLSGEVTGQELVTIFEEGWRIQSVRGYALVCINIISDWSFPSEARQALAQFHRTHKAVGASAIVGISPAKAMFIDVVLRGVAKVSGHRPKTRIFTTMADATTWLDEERLEHCKREPLRQNGE